MNILVTHTGPVLRRPSFCNVDAGEADIGAAYRFFYLSKYSKYSQRRIPDNRPDAELSRSLAGATFNLVNSRWRPRPIFRDMSNAYGHVSGKGGYESVSRTMRRTIHRCRRRRARKRFAAKVARVVRIKAHVGGRKRRRNTSSFPRAGSINFKAETRRERCTA